ncbi:hypothetical protein [Burkholderia sp. RS02]|uniref:hypothetical protein n=1 Tax=unclassified Burkholderia TaxID=2613784 RepID=UPI0032187E90
MAGARVRAGALVAGDDDDVTGCGGSAFVAGLIAGTRLEVVAGGSYPMLFCTQPASASRGLQFLARRGHRHALSDR